MPRVTKLVALTAATALTGSLLLAPAADANVHKRVKVVGGYGHVVVYDYYWHNWGWRERHKSVYPGHRSPKSWSVDYVRAVGENKCLPVLWWTKPNPDQRQGRDMYVVADRVTVRVSQARGC